MSRRACLRLGARTIMAKARVSGVTSTRRPIVVTDMKGVFWCIRDFIQRYGSGDGRRAMKVKRRWAVYRYVSVGDLETKYLSLRTSRSD